jgi:ribosome-associated translation inhibitor RaiA
MYHGFSFDYFISNIDEIRMNGGYDRADLVMKYLLQRRHLAPTFGSTPYIPTKEDHLLIKQVPDFFVSGHIHKCYISSYKNVTMICASCWESITDFQVKLIRDQHHQKGEIYTVEAKVSLANSVPIFVKETDSDARAAVDNVQEKLARLLVKSKGKKFAKLRKSIKKFRSLKFWKKKEY